MKANNKADQIERQADGQGEISLFIGGKKGQLCPFAQLREALKHRQKFTHIKKHT